MYGHFWNKKISQNSRRSESLEKYARSRSGRRGAAVVELAVTSPLLILLVLGVVEYAQFANTTQVIGNASRRGARYAARNETTSAAQVQSYVKNFVTGAISKLPDGASVQVQVVDGVGGAIANGDLTAINAGAPVAVNVSLDFSAVRWLSHFADLDGRTVQVSTIARRE